MASWFKKKIIRPVRDCMVYALACCLFFFARILPRKLLLAINGGLGRLAYRLSKKLSDLAIVHLTRVFGPEQEKGAYWRLGRSVWLNLLLSYTDFAIWDKKHPRAFFDRNITVTGEEHLKAAYQRGKGVLCLIPHTVALEFPALILPLLGYKTTWVTSRIKNPALSKLILRHRESTGTHDLVRHRCYDRLVELLRDGECVIMMSDHDSRNTRGEFVDFLGIEAYTPTGCARLAADTGAAVVPMFALRGPDGRYTFAIWPELPALHAPDGSYDILANMKQQNDAFSRIITENPDQWIWFHKRWRTTPESLERFLKSKGKQRLMRS